MIATGALRPGTGLRLGTRRSPMVLAQSGQVASEIADRTGCEITLVGITSSGDDCRRHYARCGTRQVRSSGCAGLHRIGRLDAAGQVFSPDEMLPAAGQDALAVECASDRHDLAALLKMLDDPASRAAVTAERAMLGALGAGCAAPVAAHADGMEPLRLRGAMITTDGVKAVRGSLAGAPERAADIGLELAAELLRNGAESILREVRTP